MELSLNDGALALITVNPWSLLDMQPHIIDEWLNCFCLLQSNLCALWEGHQTKSPSPWSMDISDSSNDISFISQPYSIIASLLSTTRLFYLCVFGLGFWIFVLCRVDFIQLISYSCDPNFNSSFHSIVCPFFLRVFYFQGMFPWVS